MNSLFSKNIEHIILPDAEIVYHPNFIENTKADVLFKVLRHDIQWQQDFIKVFGKTYPQPRLTSFYGDQEKSYGYSNIVMKPHPWNPLLSQIKKDVETFCEQQFTSVLLNLYRDGKDSNGWHADDEKELGVNPVIASLSLGAERVFQLRHNVLKDQKLSLMLGHGSLLLMKGTTQHFWKHQLPKTAKPIGERINLTFRFIQ